MQEVLLKMVADVFPIPTFPSEQFNEFCEEHNIEPLGGKPETSRKGWCAWLNSYVRDAQYLVYLKEVDGAFFATKEEMQKITARTMYQEQMMQLKEKTNAE